MFLAFSQSSNAISIQEVMVSHINSNDINIHVKIEDAYYIEYYTYTSEIVNNTITLNICYSPFLIPVVTYKENDFIIPNINVYSNNFTLVINIFKRMYINNVWVCNSTIDSDTATLTFSTPLNGIVSLATNEFSTIKDISVFPNPTTGIINFSKADTLNKVEVFDNLGRKVNTLNNISNDFINLSNLKNGIYFITFHSENNISTKKIILEK